MAADQPGLVDTDAPDDPEDLLSADSVLSLSEYLDMHAAVGRAHRPNE